MHTYPFVYVREKNSTYILYKKKSNKQIRQNKKTIETGMMAHMLVHNFNSSSNAGGSL